MELDGISISLDLNLKEFGKSIQDVEKQLKELTTPRSIQVSTELDQKSLKGIKEQIKELTTSRSVNIYAEINEESVQNARSHLESSLGGTKYIEVKPHLDDDSVTSIENRLQELQTKRLVVVEASLDKESFEDVAKYAKNNLPSSYSIEIVSVIEEFCKGVDATSLAYNKLLGYVEENPIPITYKDDATTKLDAIRDKISDLENNEITIKVNDSALTRLNDHIDVKQEHLGELQNDLNITSNSIREMQGESRKKEEGQSKTKSSEEDHSKNNGSGESERQDVIEYLAEDFPLLQSLLNPGELAAKSFEANLDALVENTGSFIQFITEPLDNILLGAFTNIGAALTDKIGTTLTSRVADSLNLNLEGIGEGVGDILSFMGESINRRLGLRLNEGNDLGDTEPLPELGREPLPELSQPSSQPLPDLSQREPVPVAIEEEESSSRMSNTRSRQRGVGDFDQSSQSQSSRPPLRESRQSTRQRTSQLQRESDEQARRYIREIVEAFKRNTKDITVNSETSKQVRRDLQEASRRGYLTAEEMERVGDSLKEMQRQAQYVTNNYEEAVRDLIRVSRDLPEGERGFGSEYSRQAAEVSRRRNIGARYLQREEEDLRWQYTQMLEQTRSRSGNNDIGSEVVNGIDQDIRSQMQSLERLGEDIAFNLIEGTEDALEISSPSRRYQEIGRNVTQGFRQGLGNSDDVLERYNNDIREGVEDIDRRTERRARRQNNQENARRSQSSRNSASPSSFVTDNAFTRSHRRARQAGETASSNYFDAFYDSMGSEISRTARNRGGESASSLVGEIFPTLLSGATMLNPAIPLMTALAPMVLASLPVLVAGMGVHNILSPFVDTVKNAITEIEPIVKRFEVVGGSKEAGAQELDYVQNLATNYSVPVAPAAQNYSQLAIAARGTKLEGEGVKELFEGIVASIRAMRLSTQDANLVFLAYTQLMAKGTISMEELRQQLGEKFPPAMGVFAKALDVSVAELNEMVASGSLLSEEVLPKVGRVLKEDFGDSAQSASQDFTTALVRMENIAFKFSQELTKAFSGMFAGVTNLYAGILDGLVDKVQTFSTVFKALIIAIGVQVAIAIQTILRVPAIARISSTITSFLVSTLRAGLKLSFPFFVGALADVIDGYLGAELSVFENMKEGFTQFFTFLFGSIDSLSRALQSIPLFGPDSGGFGDFFEMIGFSNAESSNLLTNTIKMLSDAIKGFFSLFPSGVIELGALMIMFEQLIGLGNLFLIPFFKSLLTPVTGMIRGLVATATSAQTLKASFKGLLLTTSNLVAGLNVLAFALQAALALAVMAFARSDFTNEVSDEIQSVYGEFNATFDQIGKDFEGLGESLSSKAEGIGEKIGNGLNTGLESQGLQLSLGKILGFSDKGFTSDDYIRSIRDEQGGGALEAFATLLGSPILGPIAGYSRFMASRTAKPGNELLSQYGLGDRLPEDTKFITTAQMQLVSQFQDAERFRDSALSKLEQFNLSEDRFPLLMQEIAPQLRELKGIEEEISVLREKRNRLASTGLVADEERIKEVDKQLVNLEKRANNVVDDVNLPLARFGDMLEKAREQQKFIEENVSDPEIRRELLKIINPVVVQMEAVNRLLEEQNLPLLQVESRWKAVAGAISDARKEFEEVRRESEKADAIATIGLYNQGITGNIGDEELNLRQSVQGVRSLQKELADITQQLAKEKGALIGFRETTNASAKKDQKKKIAETEKQIANLEDNLLTVSESLARSQYQLQRSSEKIEKALEDLSDNFNDLIDSIADKIKSIQKQINETIQEIDFLNFKNTLRDALTPGQDTIAQTLSEMILGFGEQLQEVFGNVEKVITGQLDTQDFILDTQKELKRLQEERKKQEELKQASEEAQQVSSTPLPPPSDIAPDESIGDKPTPRPEIPTEPLNPLLSPFPSDLERRGERDIKKLNTQRVTLERFGVSLNELAESIAGADVDDIVNAINAYGFRQFEEIEAQIVEIESRLENENVLGRTGKNLRNQLRKLETRLEFFSKEALVRRVAEVTRLDQALDDFADDIEHSNSVGADAELLKALDSIVNNPIRQNLPNWAQNQADKTTEFLANQLLDRRERAVEQGMQKLKQNHPDSYKRLDQYLDLQEEYNVIFWMKRNLSEIMDRLKDVDEDAREQSSVPQQFLVAGDITQLNGLFSQLPALPVPPPPPVKEGQGRSVPPPPPVKEGQGRLDEIDYDLLADAFGAIEGNYNSLGSFVRDNAGNAGRGLGRYQFMSYRSDVRNLIDGKDGGQKILNDLDSGRKISGDTLLQYFSQAEQDKLFREEITSLIQKAKSEIDPQTGKPFAGQRLIERVGQMHFGGRGIPIDSGASDIHGRLTVKTYGEEVAKKYFNSLPSDAGSTIEIETLDGAMEDVSIEKARDATEEELNALREIQNKQTSTEISAMTARVSSLFRDMEDQIARSIKDSLSKVEQFKESAKTLQNEFNSLYGEFFPETLEQRIERRQKETRDRLDGIIDKAKESQKEIATEIEDMNRLFSSIDGTQNLTERQVDKFVDRIQERVSAYIKRGDVSAEEKDTLNGLISQARSELLNAASPEEVLDATNNLRLVIEAFEEVENNARGVQSEISSIIEEMERWQAYSQDMQSFLNVMPSDDIFQRVEKDNLMREFELERIRRQKKDREISPYEAMLQIRRVKQETDSLRNAASFLKGDFNTFFDEATDGASSLGDAFSSLANSILGNLKRIATNVASNKLFDLIFGNILSGLLSPVNSQTLKGAESALNFSEGNVAKDFKVPEFAKGGMVTSPTMAMVGEGQYNEAIVPLPDGKSIPVQLGGNRTGGDSYSVNINIDNPSVRSDEDLERLSSMVDTKIRSALIDQRRSGGILRQR